MIHHPIHSIVDWWMWIAFTFPVLILIAADFLLTGRTKDTSTTTNEALTWSLFWIGLALLFNFLLWLHLYDTKSLSFANENAVYFFCGYLIEKLVSIENIIVFMMIINFYKVPARYHRRVLMYGIVGAIILRFIMIMFGVWTTSQLHWLIYLFGLFLIYTGSKTFLSLDKEILDFSENKVIKLVNSKLKITPGYHRSSIFVNVNERLAVTPLFIVLILFLYGDLIFAITSIPAIIGITQDPFIIYTSNILALLGLRSLYFLMEGIMRQFRYLKHSIAITLIFIGGKMLISDWYYIPISVTLTVIISIILGGILISKFATSKA